MVAPRARVFRPLVKGNEALGTRLMSTWHGVDLPQVDCEMRDKESEGRSRESRVDLFRLRNIEFNLHIVGAKKLGVT